MDKENKSFRSKVFTHLSQLAQESPAYEDAKMLVGSADTVASLKNNTVRRSIETEWIEKIEYAIPYLDAFIRNPGIAIQENEEILPVEVTKKVSEKSIRYLSQHTNHILKIEGDDVTPSKLLNVFRDETYQTYENKFVNTLLVRLIAFIEKRFAILNGTSGIEQNYVFDYQTSFYHSLIDSEKNSAKMTLKIELTSPVKDQLTEEEKESNKEYAELLSRIEKIRRSIMSYLGSSFIAAVGKNYIRPPVIRTNAILKNKNLNACLVLWEYIESVDKAGFSTVTDEFKEMPSDDYISELYSSVALQYLQFYSGVVGEDADNRLLSERRLNETFPDFESEIDLEEIDDYLVYDTDYKKLVSVTDLYKRKKLSEDERKMRTAIEVALRADRVLFDQFMVEDAARKKAEEERRKAEAERLAKLLEQERRKNIQYRYVRTFLSRYIQAEDGVKELYCAIKNKLLSYNKVKVRLSKKCETFYVGRKTFAKVDVRGKRVELLLALDPKMLAEKARYYNFVDVSEKKADTPMLMKVNGPIKLRRALELIAVLMENACLTAIGDYAVQDFYLPYEDTDTLVRRGLIIDLWNQTPLEDPDSKNSLAVTGGEEPDVAAEIALTAPINDKFSIRARYARTFLSRYIQAEDEVKTSYGAIKNKLLSYKKVKARQSKKCESFHLGRTTLAKIDVKGKKVDLYLALDPKTLAEKARYYNFIDVSEKKVDTPMLIKVSGPIKLRRALELVSILMETIGAVVNDRYAEQDFYLPYEDTESLVARGLIIDRGEQLALTDSAANAAAVEENTLPAEPQESVDDSVLEELGLSEELLIRENESFIQGEKCVFKPYFPGYEDSDSVIIPLTQEQFHALSERKQRKIFKSALKKFQKRTNKNK